jgi:hypothetical protein
MQSNSIAPSHYRISLGRLGVVILDGVSMPLLMGFLFALVGVVVFVLVRRGYKNV